MSIRYAGAATIAALAFSINACGVEQEQKADLDVEGGSSACTVDEPDVAAPAPPVSLVTGQACANDLVLIDNQVAWVTFGSDPNATYSGGKLAMTSNAGGSVNEWVDVHQGRRIARSGDFLYWAGRNKIGRVTKTGGSKKVLVSDSSTPLSPRDLVVDGING